MAASRVLVAVAAAPPSEGEGEGERGVVALPLLVGIGKYPGVIDTAEAFAKSLSAETGGRMSVSNITYGVDRNVVFLGAATGRAFGLSPPLGLGNQTGVDPLTAQYLGNDLPFGMSAIQFGLFVKKSFGKFWKQLYEPRGVKAYYTGALLGPQVGDWYKTPITKLRDMRGLKMRYTLNPLTAYQASVLREVGAIPVSLPITELNRALVNGSLDAVEFLGVLLDRPFRFWEGGARFLHYPGLQGPSAGHILVSTELAARAEKAFQRAAEDAYAVNIDFFYGSGWQEALDEARENGVTVARYPLDVVRGLYRAFKKIEARHRVEVGRTNPLFAQIIDEYNAYIKSSINQEILTEPAAQLLPVRSDVIAPYAAVHVPAAQRRSVCRS